MAAARPRGRLQQRSPARLKLGRIDQQIEPAFGDAEPDPAAIIWIGAPFDTRQASKPDPANFPATC